MPGANKVANRIRDFVNAAGLRSRMSSEKEVGKLEQQVADADLYTELAQSGSGRLVARVLNGLRENAMKAISNPTVQMIHKERHVHHLELLNMVNEEFKDILRNGELAQGRLAKMKEKQS